MNLLKYGYKFGFYEKNLDFGKTEMYNGYRKVKGETYWGLHY